MRCSGSLGDCTSLSDVSRPPGVCGKFSSHFLFFVEFLHVPGSADLCLGVPGCCVVALVVDCGSEVLYRGRVSYFRHQSIFTAA